MSEPYSGPTATLAVVFTGEESCRFELSSSGGIWSDDYIIAARKNVDTGDLPHRENLEFAPYRVRLLESQAGVIREISEIAVSGQERNFVVEA